MKLGTLIAAALVASVLAAGCSKNDTTPTNPSCTTTAGAPSTSAFAASGGSGTIAVTASATSCTWTATSNATFITITQGTSGTGNGSVTFTVAANTGAARTGNLTVAGSTVAISQAAAAVTTPVTLAAPVARSPIGGATVDTARPPLTVDNAAATGSPGAVTYRFEVSDQSSFPNDAARTFSVDGVAQGGSQTTGTIPRDLGPSVLWYWRARATSGTVTSDYSAVETFRTAGACAYTVSPTTVNAGGGTSTVTVTVTTTAACAWTAASNASFITISSGASGTGSGTVTLAVAGNSGATRSGTVTIAGQTVTINQSGGSIVAQFNLIDPSTQPGPTTSCLIKSISSQPTTCRLESTSFTLGTTSIVGYAWTVKYTYGGVDKQVTQDSASPTLSFSDTCGATGSAADGPSTPLNVTLIVTDSAGNQVTVTSGTGGQPALTLRLFSCGI